MERITIRRRRVREHQLPTTSDTHLPSFRPPCSSWVAKPATHLRRRMSVAIERETFLDVVCGVLAEYKYVGPTQRADFILACRIRERKESVTVLLCGASGCGKSSLSSLLGSRLGITTVISTDSIRHMMRSFLDEEQNPLLWASTYQAGEYLDPMAVAEAKAKKKMKNVAHVFNPITDNEVSDEAAFEKSGGLSLSTSELISAKQMVIEGFKAQSKMVISSLDRLIAAWEERKESVVVEGVHFSLNFVVGGQLTVSGSDEEAENATIMVSDWNLNDVGDQQVHEEVEEMEGSVDEESAMSDEEYENLAIRDSCWFDG